MDRKKLFLIFGGAWISAALLTWLLYAGMKAPKSDKTLTAVAAVRDMPAGTRLKKTDMKLVKVIDVTVPKSAVLDPNMAIERVLMYPVNQNELLSLGRLSSLAGAEGVAATIEPGKRAISIPFTDQTGAAGLIQPRSHVDILFTRPGSMSEAVTTTVLQDIIVLSIGRATEATAPATASSGNPQAQASAAPSSTATRAATLMVTPEQARKLEWAKNQGKLSLALRNPLDKSVGSQAEPTTALDLDLASFVRMNGRRGGPNVRDNKVWAQLTGQPEEPSKKPVALEKKEPPKPRYVIDVYRGDKHVQEIFQ